MDPKKQRQRRTAEDARALILEAAERRLLAVGPSGIRLQEIADDVGISHPAILHHFGSREGLVRAVVDSALLSLQKDLVLAFQSADGKAPDGADLIERVFKTLAERGHGRFLAWLILSGYDDALDMKTVQSNWRIINDAMHALRLSAIAANPKKKKKKRKQEPPPEYEDTVFTVMLSALTIFGQSIAGPTMFRMAGIASGQAAEQRFRVWLASVLAAHLAG